MQGRAYAIPTKDFSIRTLPLDIISKYVDNFINHTHTLEYYYYVTAIGTGLAGYSHNEIAPMFKGVKNCWLPLAWKEYIQN